MEDYTRQEMEEAREALRSMLHKCERAAEKLRFGTPQHTLVNHRIHALRLALVLIADRLA